jgi:hypothetical protein
MRTVATFVCSALVAAIFTVTGAPAAFSRLQNPGRG